MSIDNCIQKISELPQSEVKYYLFLLVNSIKNKKDSLGKKYIEDFLSTLDAFILNFNQLLRHDNEDNVNEVLEELTKNYQQLTKIAKTNNLGTHILYGLIQVGAAVSAFLLGITGALIGGVSGLARGFWNMQNPLSHLATGLFIGFMIGSMIGFRAPKKLFKNELTRQLKFCLDGVHECITNLQAETCLPFSHFKEEVAREIKEKYFANDDERYVDFLNQKDVEFEILTLKAQFAAGNRLEGYLGHHALIAISAFDAENPIQMEFAPKSSDIKGRSMSQNEKRQVSGEKIIEMIAMHRQLQQFHACTPSYILHKMKPGDNDCLNYINKILLGTDQECTKVKRFDGSENWVGRNIIGFFTEKLSPFSPTTFQDFHASERNSCKQ